MKRTPMKRPPGVPFESKAPAPGLSAASAAERLATEGYNELPTAARRSLLRVAADVIRQPMFALLVGGGIVYLLLGDRIEALLLIAFAMLSVVITIVQESRSERVLEALRNLASPRAAVIRDGVRIIIPGREVVREDVLLIAEGDRVAADARLLEAQDLLIDESLLTGESLAVRKSALPDAQAGSAPGGEDTPFAFAGTLVVRGSGLARVTATGSSTEMGRIGRALGDIETEQPHLQRQLTWLVRDFALVGALAGGAAVLLYGLLRGSWLEALLGGIALGMSLMPEEFPLVVTVFTAMGAWRISRARVLTRRAAAIETLGATTALCTDKTGTLTENRMAVARILAGDASWSGGAEALPPAVGAVLAAAVAACPRHASDPMDLALRALGAGRLDGPFDAEAGRAPLRGYGLRADLFAAGNLYLDADAKHATAYVKGAPETIARLAGLAPAAAAALQAQSEELARAGIRVLAVARSRPVAVGGAHAPPESLDEMSFEPLGLVGFADPLRATVPAAVAECRSAGIRVLMITGDYPATARSIGEQAGIDGAQVLTGEQIEAMSDEALGRRVADTCVFARIRPTQKLRIVEALKRNGEVVAMTGDGVNDAPAIKAAHIGIAMGGRGTEVAREASAIVLLDDDFGSIVATIRLGRRIYDNLRKAIEYIVAVHIPIAGLALLPLLLDLPLVLGPIHIAFLEMIIDPACSMVFEAEPEETDVMRRPPRDPASPLLVRRRILWAALQGCIALVLLGALFVGFGRLGKPEATLRAMVFVSLVLVNLGLILVNRSFASAVGDLRRRPNRTLWWLLGAVLGLLAISVFWAPTRALFHFGRLNGADLAVCGLVGGASLIVLEALKRRWFRV